MYANIVNLVRKNIYRRDGYRCALCEDTRGLQVHHVVHRSLGGGDCQQNLITLCYRCHNAAHGTRWPDSPEWLTQEWVEQAAVEYLSDYYVENTDRPWNPMGGDEA